MPQFSHVSMPCASMAHSMQHMCCIGTLVHAMECQMTKPHDTNANASQTGSCIKHLFYNWMLEHATLARQNVIQQDRIIEQMQKILNEYFSADAKFDAATDADRDLAASTYACSTPPLHHTQLCQLQSLIHDMK